MSKAKTGNKVKVHYIGTLKNDGSEFDNSRKREKALEFVIGEATMIPGFEQGVTGMEIGETKAIEIPAKLAYGETNKEATIRVGRDQFPPEFKLIIDEVIQGKTKTGKPALAKIIGVDEKEVTLDMNHPLAGKDLKFEVELLEIVG
tara:strand:- start:1857 stop:2294 length:438 start_codon:yes stop_codon:yes gene_type:complete